MARHTQEAVRNLMHVVIELAEIIRDLDPGRTGAYSRVEDLLVKVRENLTQAKAFERL
jgi:hypothetical protein